MVDSAQARLLCQLSFLYLPPNHDSALVPGQPAWQSAHRTRQPHWKARSLGLLAAVHYEKEEFNLAARFRRQEIALWQALHDTDRQHKALRQLGSAELQQCNYLRASEYLLQALHYFERRRTSKEYLHTLHDVFTLYSDIQENTEATHYFKLWVKAIENYQQTDEDLFDNYCSIADYHNKIGNYQFALTYVRKAQAVYRGPYETANTAYLLGISAKVYLNFAQYEQAQQAAATALSISHKLRLRQHTIYCRAILAEALSKQGEHERGGGEIRQAIDDAQATPNARVLLVVYKAAAGIAERARQFELALSYLRRFQALKDSLFGNQTKQQAKVAQAHYENYSREQQAAARRHQLAKLRSAYRVTQLYVVVVALALLAVVAGTWLLMRQRRVYAERDNAALRAHQAELQTQQQQAQEAMQQLQHALEVKNSELANLALRIKSKEQLVASVKEELRAVAQNADGVNQQRLRKMHQSLALNAQLGTNRDYMQQLLEQVHPRFFVALQHRCPNVTQSERRLAALLLLHFTTKDIAVTLSISEDSVRKARYRLRRKLGLAAEEDLSAFLYTLGEEANLGETAMLE